MLSPANTADDRSAPTPFSMTVLVAYSIAACVSADIVAAGNITASMQARIFPATRFFITLQPYLTVSYFGSKYRVNAFSPLRT